MDIMFNMHGVPIESLPPGTQHRHVFDRSLIGLEMMSGGGNEAAGRKADDRWDEQVEIAFDTAKDNWEYNTETLQMNYVNDVVTKSIQERNIENQLLYQEAGAGTEWDFEVKQRVHEFNSKVDAYNKSERLFGAQVGLNEYARHLADDSAAAVKRERLDAVHFQGMEADLKLTQAQTDITHKRAGAEIDISQTKSDIAQKQANLNLGYRKQISESDRQKQAATLQSLQRRAEAAFSSEKGLVEMMKAAGSAKAKGQVGRSAQKDIQAIMATGGRAQAQLADQITRGDSAYNLTMMGLDESLIYADAEYRLATAGLTSKGAYADLSHKLTGSQLDAQSGFAEMSHQLGAQQRDATKLSIGSAYDRALSKSEFDEYGANLQADAQRMEEPGFGPLPPKPLELPRPILMDPMLPIDIPEPREGAGSGGVGAAQGAAADTAVIVNALVSLASAGLGGWASTCDMRVKHEVASLEYTEVNDALAMLAFAVKELREYS